MVLCIAEYGYFLFFSNYKIFLEDTFSGHPQAQNMYWDQAFDIYTSEQYSQLWRGLDMQPFGYLEARKSRKSKKYQWFDEMYIKEPIKTEPVSIKDIINKL